MKRMLLLLLFFGVACGQFRRFGDSFEDDDSKENIFRRTSLNNVNRFRDSDEVFFRGSGLRSPPKVFNRFDDSKEVFFSNNNRRQSFPNTNRFRDSDERVFFGNNRRPTPFRRLDDSKEIISRDRQGNFFVDSAEDFLRRARNRFDDSKEIFFGTNKNSFRSPTPPITPLRTNNFRNNVNNRLRLDSVEDVFDDLFDDDLDDRLRAQNTLARLKNNGFDLFVNSGKPQTSPVTNFQTRVGSNRFNSPSQGTNTGAFQSNLSANRNALNHFAIPQHSNTFPTNRFSPVTTRTTNVKTNRNANINVGVPLRTNFNTQRASSATQRPATNSFNNNNNRFNSNTNRRPGNSLNSINSSPFSAAKRSSFSSPPGFNWPGGNGYYVSMSTGNSKPVTYFVKYDD